VPANSPSTTTTTATTTTQTTTSTASTTTTGVQPPSCRWYEKQPFRFSFCYAQNSAVAAVEDSADPSTQVCTAPCAAHTDCTSCGQSLGCNWCPGERTCIPGDMFAYQAAEGQCTSRTPVTDKHRCPVQCSLLTSCRGCFEHAHCGWCLEAHTGAGVCSEGDYAGSMHGARFSTEIYTRGCH
jgi:hypothetical protein